MKVKDVVLVIALALLVLMFVTAGVPKLAGLPSPGSNADDFARWGYPPWARPAVGAVEILGALLLPVRGPRFLGALLLGADMVAATLTLLAHGEAAQVGLPLSLLAMLALVAAWSHPWRLRPRSDAAAGAHP